MSETILFAVITASAGAAARAATALTNRSIARRITIACCVVFVCLGAYCLMRAAQVYGAGYGTVAATIGLAAAAINFAMAYWEFTSSRNGSTRA